MNTRLTLHCASPECRELASKLRELARACIFSGPRRSLLRLAVSFDRTRPLLRWPNRQHAALAFDHDIAGIGCGRRDQRDPAAAVIDDLVANTFRTAAGLAKAATGQQQPDPSIAFRPLLVGPPSPINLHPADNIPGIVADKPTPGSADLCFITLVPLAEVTAHLEACGVPIAAGPGPRAGAIQSVYIRHLDLNLVEISNY